MTSLVLAFFLQVLNGAGFIPARLVAIQEPNPPLNTLEGDCVLSDLTISAEGDVRQIVVREGKNPFTDASITAVKQWKFQAAKIGNQSVASSVGVITVFRPSTFGNFAVGGPTFGFSDPQPSKSDHPPLPRAISDPGYPATSIAQGVVLFELTIDQSGQLSEIRTVRDIPSLTDPASEAIRSWQFIPAMESGRPTTGRLIVAISFLRPVITPADR